MKTEIMGTKLRATSPPVWEASRRPCLDDSGPRALNSEVISARDLNDRGRTRLREGSDTDKTDSEVLSTEARNAGTGSSQDRPLAQGLPAAGWRC
ncbi:hypothetical protein BaRGS_00010007 [Batillaria attramentaria]|uniref:Uncharacterized protein n=1 Tax=Batillaria attramentaria TaxID=370345 RepID=A0ABD0LHM9_9CAEN